MKIAIDTGPLKSGDSVRGVGVYTRELLAALKIEGVDISKADLGKYDVFHFTRFNPFFISLPFKKPENTKFVLTIYDLIPLIYLSHYPPGIRGWAAWQINKFLIKKNIDAVITISETSKKDICRFIGLNPDKVYVIHLAPRAIFKRLKTKWWQTEIRKRYNLPECFTLYVGDVNYNKNIPLLIRACRHAKIPLVICGRQAMEVEKMNLNHPELRHLKGVDWNGSTRTGFVSDNDLVKIFNLAAVYIQPSLYEGFGLPVLEANAAGVAVVASKTQALIEVAGDVALFADPKSTEDFAEKVRVLFDSRSLRDELIEKGINNSKNYSWQKVAKETLKVYQGEES
jgi:glycosyltransferase involved in cell wall biosynthesis